MLTVLAAHGSLFVPVSDRPRGVVLFLLPLGLTKPLVLPGVNKKALANIFGDTRAKIRRKDDLSLKGTRSFLHKVSGLQK